MAHEHEVFDTDLHFVIDPKTRIITNKNVDKAVLMQHDHNSERYTFEVPRYIDDHDMSLCNQVRVHYINTDGLHSVKGIYAVSDVHVNPDDEKTVIFSWLISGNATKYAGNLSFVASFECVAGSKVDYRWQTVAHTDAVVSRGIYNTDSVAEGIVDDALVKAVETYLNENPIGAEIDAARTDAVNAKLAAEAAQAASEDIIAECRELAEMGGLTIDTEVTPNGAGAVSGAAVAAYVAAEIAKIADYEGAEF